MTPTEQAQRAIQRAHVTIADKYQMFGPALQGLESTFTNSVPTACTDGDTVDYNVDYVNKLAPEETVGLVIHEILHPLLDHLARSVGMDPALANQAFDYEINNFIESYNRNNPPFPITLPPGALVDLKEYGNLAGEVVYGKLADKQADQPRPRPGGQRPGNPTDEPGDEPGQPGQQPGNQPGQPGQQPGQPGQQPGQPGQQPGQPGNQPGQQPGQPGNQPGQKTKPESSSCGEFKQPTNQSDAGKLRDKWQEIMGSVVQLGKLRGTLPGDLLQKFTEQLEPPLSLRERLERLICQSGFGDDSTRADRSWMANHDIFVAGCEVERHGKLVFVKDTSGSMNSRILQTCVSVVQDAVNKLNATSTVVLDVDTRVNDVQEFLPGEDIPATCKGGGGTDFCPAFDWVEQHCPDARAIIYLTDGEGRFPSVAPHIPVVWISFGLTAEHYPFGEVAYLDELSDY